jgi:hypothetical protein
MLVWTAPNGIGCARIELFETQNEGAVHEQDYPHWARYV